MGNAYQQDFAAHIFQAVIAATGGAGRVAQFLTCEVGNSLLPIPGHAVGGVQAAYHTGTLAEQLRQNAYAAGEGAHIKHRVGRVDGAPGVGGQQQQPRQLSGWECRNPRSFFPRLPHIWRVHLRAMQR